MSGQIAEDTPKYLPRRFDGKVVLVTGGGKGIGRATVLRLAAEGATVLAVGKSDSVNGVAAEAGPAVTAYQCDVSDIAAVEAMSESLRKKFGRLDGLCNNAGVSPNPKPLLECSLADLDSVFATNLRGPFAIIKYCIPLMVQSGGGSVVSIASIGGLKPAAGRGLYSATKAALEVMTRALAVECAPHNIRANTICPGPVRTPASAGLSEEAVAAYARVTLLGRWGRADEIAALTAFLLSDEASYITAANYVVDGGALAAR